MKTATTGSGYSLRQKAFALFFIGERPAEVAIMLNMKKTTCYRYFQQWKTGAGSDFIRYEAARDLWTGLSEKDVNMIIDLVSDELVTSNEVVLERMQKPWALKQLITGEWRNWKLPIQEKRKPSRLSEWVGQILNRRSEEVELLLELILCQEEYTYLDEEEDEDIDEDIWEEYKDSFYD